ncbi:MAG TPA: hypothetical protein VMT98_03190 [Verrucomicrobiae bacterium]|nr:hypothetical protein [Verrucomicrobiae bacterium]
MHRLLGRTYRYNEMAMGSSRKTMWQLAAEAGVVRSYFTRILRLSFLAPDIAKMMTMILRDGANGRGLLAYRGDLCS